ncbi:hypothetical protein OSB04_028912 [Centaurea solstitialis]|uniref:Uncharacterized protein n=1 Tax=Centaurea solstitialis TaxID=347529 RepID=A0AA38WBN1_9ASTR|nr:hypothetical protein OSB04_028912 [Centaurea solstitialis]
MRYLGRRASCDFSPKQEAIKTWRKTTRDKKGKSLEVLKLRFNALETIDDVTGLSEEDRVEKDLTLRKIREMEEKELVDLKQNSKR